jgi:hypothetical protein
LGGATVAHVSTVHPAFDIRIFHKECRSLAHAGFDVSLVVCHDRNETVDRIRVAALPRTRGRLARIFVLGPLALLQALRSGARICHLHDPELVPIGLLLKLAGRAVIYDAHEDLPRQIMSKHWIRPRLRALMARVSERVEDFSVARFDAVIAATPLIGRRFLAHNPNTVVVNNFPLASEFPDIPCWAERERAVCYLGGISRERGIGDIVRAMEEVDAVLHLAGTVSPPAYLQELQGMPGWEKVRFHGLLDRVQVFELLRRSRVGLVCLHPEPNYIESQPIKLYEYWSAGVPVVASNFPSWQELIVGNEAGLCVDPGDTTQIARALRLLLEDEDVAVRMGQNGLRLVRAELNWTNEEAKLVGVYHRLATAG